MPDEPHNLGDIQLPFVRLVHHNDVEHRIAARVVTFFDFDGDQTQIVELLPQDFPDYPGGPIGGDSLWVNHTYTLALL